MPCKERRGQVSTPLYGVYTGWSIGLWFDTQQITPTTPGGVLLCLLPGVPLTWQLPGLYLDSTLLECACGEIRILLHLYYGHCIMQWHNYTELAINIGIEINRRLLLNQYISYWLEFKVWVPGISLFQLPATRPLLVCYCPQCPLLGFDDRIWVSDIDRGDQCNIDRFPLSYSQVHLAGVRCTQDMYYWWGGGGG